MSLYDRTVDRVIGSYIFELEKGEITSLAYGPYDNGHICVGFSRGLLTVLNPIDLHKLFEI